MSNNLYDISVIVIFEANICIGNTVKRSNSKQFSFINHISLKNIKLMTYLIVIFE